MVRPPCCDKFGVKKGPWTPEEDIILVSYIQEHGPGNWRAVPANTGLLRCSKSCRLRWTNYLRPGIKRGNFTEHEEKLIVHLQALLGNRWAAIASYLPERTDNDVKNYWNTHLKKKLKKLSGNDQTEVPKQQDGHSSRSRSSSKGQWEKRLQTDINTAKQALCNALSLNKPSGESPENRASSAVPTSSSYASSADNIARLLKNWTDKKPKSAQAMSANSFSSQSFAVGSSSNSPSDATQSATPMFSFNSSSSDASKPVLLDEGADAFACATGIFEDQKQSMESNTPLMLMEKWLFDEDAGQRQEDLMDILRGNC